MFTFYSTPQGLAPADAESRDWMNKLKSTEIVHGNLTRQRNSKFHRKYFALLQYAFDCWKEDLAMRETHRIYKGAPVMPNFERFRKDIAILCGFYEPVYTLASSRKPATVEATEVPEDRMDVIRDLAQKLFPSDDEDEERAIVIHSLIEYERQELEKVRNAFGPQMRLVAKSISFAKMSEDEFEGLYSKTIDILLERIASLPQDKKEVREIVDNLVAYA